MAEQNSTTVSKESLWYVDNYIVLVDYYDRTISRIAARCVRMGNIAIEEYKFYPYVLDVLEEICDTGNYIIEHTELHPYVNKKIAGGIEALKRNLSIHQQELTNNQTPEMLKPDANEITKINEAMSNFDKSVDPTVGAGMNIDELMNKLMAEQNSEKENSKETNKETSK
ncbi:MAG: hypothetical protein MJ212_03095 [Alphaproteobacteria bacterium]|nr:hypothetical protein [Alphaproteobacteria bacterium]